MRPLTLQRSLLPRKKPKPFRTAFLATWACCTLIRIQRPSRRKTARRQAPGGSLLP